MSLALDYTPWDHRRQKWASPQELLAAASLVDGVHSVQAQGLPLDLLLVNGARLHSGAQAVLPVFFSGAVSGRDGKPGPFFSGSGLAASKGIAALCIADPSLALHPDIGLAWYAGSSQQHTQAVLHELLAGLADRLQVELLLIGGSGAGFAALHLGSRLGDRASALVWNPQTDLLAYYRNAVRTYLRGAFPGEAWQDDARLTGAAEMMVGKGISHAVHQDYAAGRLPRRLVYLQNASDDFHVLNHAGALLAGMSVEAEGNRYRTADGRALLWFGDWGQGHEPIPKQVLDALIDLMIDPATSTETIGRYLRAAEEAVDPSVPRQPLSFRHEAKSVQLKVGANVAGQKLQVNVAIDEAPAACVSGHFAFYVYSGAERIQTRWYESDSKAEFPLLPGKPPTRVVAFARDSFGSKIQAPAQVKPERPPDRATTDVPEVGSGAPTPASVFVLGSCVSRDAFASVETDMTLVRYVARTSLASAFHRAPAPAQILARLTSIDSEWQRRMVEIDLARKLPGLLKATRFDVVLLDLIDERFPLLMLDGVPVTVSTEFKKTGIPENSGERLELSSGARMQLWLQGLKRLLAVVDPAKIIINRVYWASRADDGELLDNQESIRVHNAVLGEMYAKLDARYPFATIDYPPNLLVADRRHRWGVSPFHYVPEMYEHTISRLGDLAMTSS